MLALLAFIPILVTLVLMMGFNWKAKWALLVSWLMATVFAFFFWDINLKAILASSIFGMLSSTDVLIIIFGGER